MIKDKTIDPLVRYIQNNQPVSAHNISQWFWINRNTIHIYLRFALEKKLILKHWRPPHVLYTVNSESNENKSHKIYLDYDWQKFLDQRFWVYDVTWREMFWYNWFVEWCEQRSLDVKHQYKAFYEARKKITKYRDNCWLIDKWYIKFKKQVWDCQIDDLYYLDVYQLYHFGKSLLGNMAFYSKQSQSRNLISKLWNITKNQILCHIKNNNYDAICYIPPSLKRGVQILDELKNIRNINLPEIKLKKLYTNEIIIPQKSIKWTPQRIRNARETIYLLPNQNKHKNLLIIDDFVWSGATINESARKIKNAWLAKNIKWLALVWNVDLSYDIISEV